jgi:hypothetical protein
VRVQAKLSRALLVCGKSSYDSFPYRHSFVTMHEVVHEQDGARLAEGHLVTPEMLIALMSALGQSVPVEFLPDRVLVVCRKVTITSCYPSNWAWLQTTQSFLVRISEPNLPALLNRALCLQGMWFAPN